MRISQQKIYTFFRNTLSATESTNGWYVFDCPICGGKHKGAYHPSTDKVKCWKGCYYTNTINFVKLFKQVEYSDALSFLNSFQSSDVDLSILNTIPKVQRKESIELPYGYRNILEGRGILAQRARKYLVDRKFDLDYLSEKGFGYVGEHNPEEEEDYFGYIIVPFKQKRRLVYYIGRTFIDSFLRYKNPTKDKFGIGKGDLFFNEDALDLYDTVFLHEGWADAMTIGDNNIASLGWHLSPTQREKIIKSQIENLVIVPDLGFYQKAIKLGSSFIDYKDVYVLDIRTLEKYGKDSNEWGRDRVLDLYKNTEKLTMSKLILELV